jgi:glycosyltransferase involved in cell wall biosynthesis
MPEFDSGVSVAVAIPAFNAERFIGQALASVFTQSYPVDDVVVIDDGSDDATADAARAAGPRVRVLRQPNAGIGVARSRAVAATHGEILVLLDADDLLTPDGIACRVQALQDDPRLDVAFGQVRHFAEHAGDAPIALDPPQPAHVVSGVLLRRAAYERVGPFASGLHVAEALDWMLRARELGLREVTLPDQVLWRRVHGANNSITNRASLSEFPRALKASLDRRRAHAD